MEEAYYWVIFKVSCKSNHPMVLKPGSHCCVLPGCLAVMLALLGVFTFPCGLSNLGSVFKDSLHFI